MTEPTGSFYVTGGTLKPGEPSYVERRADTELFESLLAGELCYVLTARQMGKSSLMARTAKRLEQVGVASAIVDLTQIGSERGSQAAAQWYFGVANKIHQQLKIAEPLRPWWQERADLSSVQRLTDFFREIVLAHHHGKVVVFVDEIDSTIGLPFADDFFAAIRACFNARATEPDFERLTFVLLGVATPDQLIRDQTRTPFNIGKRIDLTDFSLEEAQGLASALHADPGEAGQRLERVLHWTGGHPYLTQTLCRAVREKGPGGTAEQAVDPRVQELFLTSQAQREETNLKHARARLERPGAEGRRLLQLYRRIRQGETVPDQPTSPLFAQLKLAGVVKAREDGRLTVRNRIYEAVFTPAWARSAMPADRGRQLAGVTLAAFLAVLGVWYSVFQPRPYEQALQTAIEDDGYNTAIKAYRALHANPFSRSRATDLMQKFWKQRALKYAQEGKRDESLISYLQGLNLGETDDLRRKAKNLIGADYEELQRTTRHGGPVHSVTFSPEGTTVTTASGDGSIQIWDIQSGKISRDRIWRQELLQDMALSSNGRVLATATMTRGSSAWADSTNVRLWDIESKQSIGLLPHPDRISAITFSPDGRTLATATRSLSGSGAVRLWDVQAGKLLGAPLQNEGSHALAFSPNGRILATGADDNKVRLWDVSKASVAASLGLQASVDAIAFSPDGQTLATASQDGTLQLWDIKGKPISSKIQFLGRVRALAFNPNGQTLATGFADGTARLWTLSGKSLTTPLLNQDYVTAVAFSGNGEALVTGSTDGTTRLWKIRTSEPPVPPQHYQSKDVIYRASFGPDGRVLAIAQGHSAQLLNVASLKLLANPFQHRSPVIGASLIPNGSTLVTLACTPHSDCTVQFWDVRTRHLLPSPLLYKDTIPIWGGSPDGRLLATTSGDVVRLWDVQSGKSLFALKHDSLVLSVTFSSDSNMIATGTVDTVQIWSTLSGAPIAAPIAIPDFPVTMNFSPDKRFLAIGLYNNNAALLLDVRLNRIRARISPLQSYPRYIVFNPNGRKLVVGTDRWLNIYSWNGSKATPQSIQLLHGTWMGSYYFPANCESCLQMTLRDSPNSFHLETLSLDQPSDPPIEGDPRGLLEKWQERLGLTFDADMRPVPR